MHNGADNRLTETFLTQALKPALDTVERLWRENWRAAVASKDEKLAQGAVILVGNTKQDKFFSNGASHFLVSFYCVSQGQGLWDCRRGWLTQLRFVGRPRFGGVAEGPGLQDKLLPMCVFIFLHK